MMSAVFTHNTESSLVRIHVGKQTKEVRKAVIENAAKEFYKHVQKAEALKSKV